jgi:hypothetical protein
MEWSRMGLVRYDKTYLRYDDDAFEQHKEQFQKGSNPKTARRSAPKWGILAL